MRSKKFKFLIIPLKSRATDLLAPLGLTYSRDDNLTNGGEEGALGGDNVKVKTVSHLNLDGIANIANSLHRL